MDDLTCTLRYDYHFSKSRGFRISTPDFNANWSEVTKIAIDDGKITGIPQIVVFYPNGFAYYVKITGDDIYVRTSHKLGETRTGTFEPLFPED